MNRTDKENPKHIGKNGSGPMYIMTQKMISFLKNGIMRNIWMWKQYLMVGFLFLIRTCGNDYKRK